jgi:hypothetical protein
MALFITTLLVRPELCAQSAASSESSEYMIKAGFIYNFAKLVEWPGAAFPQPASPMVIGVIGNTEFADVITSVVQGKKHDGRSFVIKSLKWGKDTKEFKDCHILFIASAEKSHADELIQMLKGTSILTIAETPNFAKRGGMINFTMEDSKFRFEVNVEAAKQADLTISSRLLSLAKVVQQAAMR